MTLTLTVLLQLLCPQPLSARDDSDDIYDMSLDENLLTPEIKNDKQADKIQEKQLEPFLRMVKNPGFYKLLLVMHSDNTGSPEYTLNLTRQRVNTIFDWFDENGSVDYVVPYALGDTDPIVDNNSVENRKRNRRLELFLVPEKTMIQQAKKGRINIHHITKEK